ncbi:phage holin family protein [Paenibacillus aquistagni]|uniref:Toxin secretion/phage lysis holin n=1 Tax=Paenibacillus aquistagni TaxID=1852522 RepID=A0A1X7LWD7_9BACL|nr:phage holin family protein [Paenibacillus aquistagni]SMG58181.1 toxin secretion/phage lysis holin [Paenibacillus aquistagni]
MKENGIGLIVATVGTIGTAYLGGWDIALRILVFCMIADYVTGVLGAIRTRTLNSEVMFWGGIRKAIIFVVIALAVMLDEYVGDQSPIFRTLAMYFYVGREGISIVENLGVLNVPLPSFVKKILEQLQEKGDGSNGNYPKGQ